MLIEIFTDGKVVIDGQTMDQGFRAEHILYEYLVNPKVFTKKKLKQTA